MARPTVATITASGVAVTLAPGTTTITAARGAVSGTYALRVFGQALEIAPLSPTRAVGQTVQFTASEGGGRTAFLGPSTWTSTTPTVATVSSTGLATALTRGTPVIRASAFSAAVFATITGETTLTVLPVLTALTIPPGTLSSPVGESFQLQALGTFTDASTRDLTSLVTWATSNAAVAAVAAGGLVTTVGIGLANITVTRDGITGTLALTVTGPRPRSTIAWLAY